MDRGLLSDRLPAAPPRRRALEAVWCAILAVIAAAVFGEGLSRHLHSDDWVLMQWARPAGISTVGRWFSPEIALAWGFRPAVLAAATITSLFGEGRPQHQASLLLHLGTAILLFLVVRDEAAGDPGARRRIDRLWPAGVASLLFLLHPAHDEAVYWFSAIAYPLAGCLGLAYWLLSGSPRAPLRALSWLALAGALLSHPTAAVFPLARLVRPPARSGSRGAAALASVLALAFLGFSVWLGAPTSGAVRHPALSALPGHVGSLAARAVWPLGPPIVATALASGLAVLSVLSVLRGDRVVPAAALVLLGSAAASAAAFPGVESPRYLYLPVLGVCLLLGALFSRNAPGKLVTLGLAVFVLARGAGTNARRATAWNAAGELGDRVLDALMARVPAGPASLLLAGEPDNLDGAYVYRHGLAERLRRARPDLQVSDERLSFAPLLDPKRLEGRRAFLFDGASWLDVSTDRRGPCLTLLRPGQGADGFLDAARVGVRLEAGPKRLLLFARGAEALGEPALLEVRYAGRPAGAFRTTGRTAVYETPLVASGGEDLLELKIANDFYDAARKLDRNLYVELAVLTCR